MPRPSAPPDLLVAKLAQAESDLPRIEAQRIAALPCVHGNGGRRGYLVGMTPADLMRVLGPELVVVAVPTHS